MKVKARTCLILLSGTCVVLAAAPLAARPMSDARLATPTVTPWKTVAASGPVHARPAASEQAVWRSVTRGDELMPQTTVTTGRKGRVTLTRLSSVLVVEPDSRVELPGAHLGGMETSIVQTSGSVLYKVDSRSTPHFEVVTPYLVAGVKGTSFLVTVNDRYASVTVRRGRAEIMNPVTGDRHVLGPGESVVRPRDAHEMELVRDHRHAREARKEAKRLDRMDERESRRDGKDDDPLPVHDDVSGELIERMIREAIRGGAIEPPRPDSEDPDEDAGAPGAAPGDPG
jgi:ferric-dicitrate binding protein FerR (iron transport regulator)